MFFFLVFFYIGILFNTSTSWSFVRKDSSTLCVILHMVISCHLSVFPLILGLRFLSLPDCGHCKASRPTSLFLFSSLVPFLSPLLSSSLSPGTIAPHQHSWLPSLLSACFLRLSFTHPSTQPCVLLLLFTLYLSTAEIPVTLTPLLIFLLSTFVFFRRGVEVTVVSGRANSSTTCHVWIRSCKDWGKRHRDEKQKTEERSADFAWQRHLNIGLLF